MKLIFIISYILLITISLWGQNTTFKEAKGKNHKIIIAAEEGNDSLILSLLKKGANINSTTYNGFTPLMFAAQNGHYQTVKTLVSNKANVNSINSEKASALLFAVENNHETITKYLIQKGAKINHQDINGVTGLIYSAAFNFHQITDILLYSGANINIKDNEGHDALIAATMNGNTDIVNILLLHNANPNSINNNKSTPLTIACYKAFYDIIILLIQYNANTNYELKNGITPLSIAIHKKDTNLVDLLIYSSAKKDTNAYSYTYIPPYRYDKIFFDKKKQIVNKPKYYREVSFPNFNTIGIGLNMTSTYLDGFLSGSIGIKENTYNRISISGGYGFRPNRKKILLDENKISYQYWEKRHFCYIDITKQFCIVKDYSYDLGFITGLKGVQTKGSLIGTSKNSKNLLLYVPKLGIYCHNEDILQLELSYEYMNFSIEKIPKHWVSVSLIFDIFLGSR